MITFSGIWVGGFAFYWVFLFSRGLPSSTTYTEYVTKANSRTTKWAQIIFDLMPERSDENEVANAITLVNDKVFPTESFTESFFPSTDEEDEKTRL
ncbi:hypothetical protein COOONC_21899 [Cooperia oncophora]